MKIALFSSKIVFFSHKNRLVRAAPSDLVQVPSKNVWVQSPAFLLYVD